MSGHFDDEAACPAVDYDQCAYCLAVRDEPCSQFISRSVAAQRCGNLHAHRAAADLRQLNTAGTRIQIGPTDV